MEAYQQLKVEKWDRRHWAVYDGPELVCVTVYKKGAVEVKRRLEDAMSPGVEIASSPAYRPTRLRIDPNSVCSDCVTPPQRTTTELAVKIPTSCD